MGLNTKIDHQTQCSLEFSGFTCVQSHMWFVDLCKEMTRENDRQVVFGINPFNFFGIMVQQSTPISPKFLHKPQRMLFNDDQENVN